MSKQPTTDKENITSNEYWSRQRQTALTVLAIAKQQEAAKLKSGYRYVTHGKTSCLTKPKRKAVNTLIK